MNQDWLEKIIEQASKDIEQEKENFKIDNVTEFVGTSLGSTIGLVIASIDSRLAKKMELGGYRSIGIIGSRIGAGPQIMAVDEAVKASNTEVISVEMPRDTKSGAGQGCLIYIGADDVSDARRAVELTLDFLPKYFGDIYKNEAGHIEFQYTARASQCINKAFSAPMGKSFGLICAGPAAIGTVLADNAVKAASIEIIDYLSPDSGANNSNQVMLTISGDSDAVKESLLSSRQLGLKLLASLGDKPEPKTRPYID